MKMFLIITGAIIAAFALLFVGCAALVGAGANEVVKEMNKSSITQAQYAGITTGMSRSAVEAQLGAPASDQDMNIDVSEFGGGVENSQCIYYNEVDESLSLSMYQFCFDNDRLSSKSKY